MKHFYILEVKIHREPSNPPPSVKVGSSLKGLSILKTAFYIRIHKAPKRHWES